MVEKKYYIKLSLQGSSAKFELLTLHDNTILSEQNLEWTLNTIDSETNHKTSLSQLSNRLIQSLQQCVVSANAAPGKIDRIEINVITEFILIGVSQDEEHAVIVYSNDSFDEHLQQTIDLIKLLRKKPVSKYFFMPLHAWIANVFTGQPFESPALLEIYKSSDFFNAEKKQWHANALKALNIYEDQLPKGIKAHKPFNVSKTGLITSVTRLPINYTYH